MPSYAFYHPATATLGRERPAPYTVDGSPADPPEDHIEVEVLRTPFPADLPATQKATPKITVSLESKTFTHGWEIEDLSTAELRAQLRPLTQRQFRLWLQSSGKITKAKEFINKVVPEADRPVAQIEWEHATAIERTHPLVDAIGQYLDLTPAEIDSAFLDAAQL